jgi:hypothetical protein
MDQTWADLEELFGLPGGSIVRGCWCLYYRKVGQVGIGKAQAPSNKAELHGLVRSGVVPGTRWICRRLARRMDQPWAA